MLVIGRLELGIRARGGQPALLKVYGQAMRRRWWLGRPGQGVLLLVYIAVVEVLELGQHLMRRV